ncbi:hypothetical protein RSAG8_05642, partial [Rhizoctonia solani AG-8 WAC10335]
MSRAGYRVCRCEHGLRCSGCTALAGPAGVIYQVGWRRGDTQSQRRRKRHLIYIHISASCSVHDVAIE